MIKLTKKDLKTPDQIWQTSQSLLGWLTDQFMLVVAAAVLVFVGIVAGVYFYQRHQKFEGSGQYHYSLARSEFEKWKLAVGGKKPQEIKEAFDSLKKELDLLEKDYQSSFANRISSEIRAQIAVQDKKWSEAALAYRTYVKALPSSDKDLGLLPLAYVYEESGDFANAIKSYDEILTRKDSLYSPFALLGKGRVLRAMKKNEEAKQVYETFLERHPTSPEIAEVRGLVSLLRDDLKK